MENKYTDEPNLENQVKVRQQRIEELEKELLEVKKLSEGRQTDRLNKGHSLKKNEVLISEQKEMISILSRDLARICHDSYELLLLASIPASHSKEVYTHLESCAAVIGKLTEQRNDEVMEALDVSED